MDAYQFDIVPDGADYHRCFYRGEDLTSVFESGEFSASVANGSFRGIFPGDYITRKVTMPDLPYTPAGTYTVRFIIADFDFATCRRYAAHHAVIIPEEPILRSYMNPTNNRTGGYDASYMNHIVMPSFALGLSEAFGVSHLLRFNADGQSCLCRLMTLHMVFGGTLPCDDIYGCSYSDYKEVDKCMGEEQLAAFRNNPDLRGKGMMRYWVSDVCDSSVFAVVEESCGNVAAGVARANTHSLSCAVGVRPFALLV